MSEEEKMRYLIIGFCAGARILLKEKFKIKLKDGSASADYYRLTESGLQVYSELTDDWYYVKDGVEKMLSGKVKVIKVSSFPHPGDEYYLVIRVDESKMGVTKTVWENSHFDICNYMHGNYFKTKEEAEEGAKNFLEDFCEDMLGLQKNISKLFNEECPDDEIDDEIIKYWLTKEGGN